MAWIRGVAAVAAMMLVGGCAGIAGQAQPQLGAQPKVAHPTDRDENAVLAGLRKLDACALLAGGPPVPVGPHACSAGGVMAAVGMDSDFGRRWGMNPTTIGGTKAYWDSGEAGCQMDIPVSFKWAVYLRTGASDKNCDKLRAAAATAIAKLGNPDAVAVPASRPFANWDGCTLLEKALGGFDAKTKLRHDLVDSRFDTCGVGESPAQDGTIDITYATDPLSGNIPTRRQVGDKTAAISTGGGACTVLWGAGPSGSDQEHDTVEIDVRGRTCDAAVALAVKAQQVLAGPPPSNDKPQRPLLYGTNDPDSAAAGACVDFQHGDVDCEPYQPITLPSSFADWFAGSDQKSISCAISVDAVREVYGDAFKPVLQGDFCYYVEPTHAVLLRIDVSKQFRPGDYGNRPDLYANVQTTTVSGKQAKTFTDSFKAAKPAAPTYHEYDVYVSPFNDLAKDGMITGQAEATVPRGGDVTKPMDVSRLHDLDRVMAKIIAKYVP
ncbi:hypothetical protein [Kutzneria buriramensis]|uniref:Septum formation-related domain-containing protein n=1 Tax=Kutzneria buriramensis TaxID=1045776 RepID=A0A3E0HQG2_9PSEU|nr:hypothetical protein [Kutzneria buriramensis]REH48649.1 hypothetical protein BCF44_105508 [Kutzneria buriramensis]